LNFNDLSLTKVQAEKTVWVWGDTCANDSYEYRRADSGPCVRAQDGHHHRQIFRFASGGCGRDGFRLEPLISEARIVLSHARIHRAGFVTIR